nr:PREDICTED: uncharacterized protein LOC105667354 [Linepithema humile]
MHITDARTLGNPGLHQGLGGLRDVATVEVDFTADSDDRRKMVVCPAYFSHDEGEAVPPAPVIKLAEYCQEKRLSLIMGCDANAHHTVWGSSDTNERGRKVLEFLASTDLEILNTGDEPTFCTIARREVLDITVCSRQLIQEVVEEDLASSLRGFPKRHGTEDELETCVDYLQKSLVNCYKSNCPERAVTNSRGTSWWTPGLQGLRVAARRAWNRAKNTGRQSDWSSLRGHRRSIETLWLGRNWKAGESFARKWRECPKRQKSAGSSLGTRMRLLEVNFQGFHREPGELFAFKEPGSLRRARQADWRMAAKIVMPEMVKWAINAFKPYKSAGPDGVFPALLQKGLEQIVGPLTRP